jgi:hypothetical protein
MKIPSADAFAGGLSEAFDDDERFGLSNLKSVSSLIGEAVLR